MAYCDKGHKASSVQGGIVDGKFGQYCPPHIRGTNRQASAQWAQWYRERDYEDHRRDVIQPFDAHGHINPEFVKEYPEESAEMFSEEEMQNALREV